MLFAFIHVLIFISCSDNSDDLKKGLITNNNYPRNNWTLIKRYKFQNINKNDTIQWVNIANPNLNNINKSNLIIINSTSIKIHFDYPLNVTVTYNIESKSGFSRLDIIKIINEKYQLIYKEEGNQTITIGGHTAERFSNVKTKYGICCHDIKDLDLSAIVVYKDKSECINVILEIES